MGTGTREKTHTIETEGNRVLNQTIASNKGQPKTLWKNLNKLLRRNKDLTSGDAVTVDMASSFFAEKVQTIRDTSAGALPPAYTVRADGALAEFGPCTVEEVRRVILQSPAKSCLSTLSQRLCYVNSLTTSRHSFTSSALPHSPAVVSRSRRNTPQLHQFSRKPAPTPVTSGTTVRYLISRSFLRS